MDFFLEETTGMPSNFTGNHLLIFHGISALSHLCFLLGLSVVWYLGHFMSSRDSERQLEASGFLFYRLSIFTSMSLGLLHLPLSVLIYLWYRHDYILFTIEASLTIRSLAWFAATAYLLVEFGISNEERFPTFLRIWWGLFLPMSCSCLVVDMLYLKRHEAIRAYQLVFDSSSIIAGLILNYSGFFGQRVWRTNHGEPLLDGSNRNRSSTEIGSGHSANSLFENASILSILSFSWIGPLLSVGHKKTLELKDVPQLASNDSVHTVFPIFKSILQSYARATAHCRITSFMVRSSLVALIYQKGLMLSSHSRQSVTSGEILTYMSTDASRVGDLSWFILHLLSVPVQIFLSLLILYPRIGVASLVSLMATFLVMLLNIPLTKCEQNYTEKLMKSKDNRIKATTEILKNMRILKLQAWEMKFLSKVMELRKTETKWLWKYACTSAAATFLFSCSSIFVAVVAFGTCMLMGIPLETGKVLSALATFRLLQDPIFSLPDVISGLVQTKVSADRISTFLNLEDLQHVVQKLPRDSCEVSIEVSNGNFAWDPSSQNLTLKEVNLQVLKGRKVAVCGSVGSGKTSLLHCILGEVPKISGDVKLYGTTSYVSQSPWILSGSIQDNILFGKQMDNVIKYERVLEACSLKKDLEIMPLGDQTIIGERGINLSGGQKQRVQIARALYHDADIYLFDDPFSAVDAHTASHLFKECLLGLLSSKTVVYVTHQVEFLPSADLILVIRDGRVAEAGTYTELVDSGTEFMQLVNAHNHALVSNDLLDLDPQASSNSTQVGHSDSMVPKEKESVCEETNSTSNEDSKKGQLVQEEEREKGKVGFQVYWRYITMAYKGTLVPFIILSLIFYQVLEICGNYWMALEVPLSDDTEPRVSGSTLISVYVALAVGSSACILVRTMLTMTAGLKTATLLFNSMHTCIFRAPISFFDSTPTGRILSRVSSEQGGVDMQIPFLFSSFAFLIIRCLGTITVMSQVNVLKHFYSNNAIFHKSISLPRNYLDLCSFPSGDENSEVGKWCTVMSGDDCTMLECTL
ncbi:hypothetical protein ZIOFF_022364 [Zingiber officinale]|uniref:ABC transporter C family member 3 n=1 Tax=Zingiber officinale TaxID=94328 RepID=A0A8J5LK39_ZINOF|nr:hypothetical protein ZIOFF_022364 [Zingiber officinale]